MVTLLGYQSSFKRWGQNHALKPFDRSKNSLAYDFQMNLWQKLKSSKKLTHKFVEVHQNTNANLFILNKKKSINHLNFISQNMAQQILSSIKHTIYDRTLGDFRIFWSSGELQTTNLEYGPQESTRTNSIDSHECQEWFRKPQFSYTYLFFSLLLLTHSFHDVRSKIDWMYVDEYGRFNPIDIGQKEKRKEKKYYY